MTILARRYAVALFALASKEGAAEAVAEELGALHAEFRSREARALLTNPEIGTAERGIVLEKIGHGRHRLVQNLLGVLQHRRRLEVLFDIYPEFRTLLLASRGEVEGVVESARPLDDDELSRVADLAERLSGKKVLLSTKQIPELIGGVRLRIGNQLYDGSMQSTLEQLESALLRAPI